jgi:hypothetical protein
VKTNAATMRHRFKKEENLQNYRNFGACTKSGKTKFNADGFEERKATGMLISKNIILQTQKAT